MALIKEMRKPVFIMAFANDAKNPLKYLPDEERAIYRLFEQLNRDGVIQLISIPYPEADDIFRNFHHYYERVCIFHFAGHSDYNVLQLSDRSLPGSSLSSLMGSQKDMLRIVFLNGCANKAQVDSLQNAGVNTIIATSRKIGDETAYKFAFQFYQGLINGSSIKEAFSTSKEYISADNKEVDIRLRDSKALEEFDDAAPFPWGLYMRDNDKLNWRIKNLLNNEE